MKFLIYTVGASALMLVGILAVGFAAGSFNMIELAKTGSDWIPNLFISAELAFLLIMAAFAVKLPIWPFHTWLQTPTPTPPLPSALCWPACFSRWGATASSGSPSASFPKSPISLGSGWRPWGWSTFCTGPS